MPDWPNPATQIRPQFVHYFGRAVERRRHGDHAWPDEIKFCKARRALRFDSDLALHVAGPREKRLRPECALRRLFSDGKSVVRVEVGVVLKRRRRTPRALTLHQILTAATDLCELPTRVPQVGAEPIAKPLVQQGPSLSRLFSRATLGRLNNANSGIAESLVEAGDPLLVIELAPGELAFPEQRLEDLDGFVHVNRHEVPGVDLAFGRLRTRRAVIDTWVIWCRGGPRVDSVQLRSLRLCLMRLHAEQQSLDLVLKQIQRKRILNPATRAVVDDIDAYFNQKTRLIKREEWGGVKQSAILDAFDAAEEVTPPDTRLNLIDRYDGARRQVWKKIEDYQVRRAAIRVVPVVNVNPGGTYVDRSVTVNQSGTGIVNVAEFMSHVTNEVNANLEKSSSPDETKALLKQLADQITAISSKIDPKLTQRMGNDLKTLTTEMSQTEPRKAWYELSLKGLKEAAEAVGAIAQPIVKTVQTLTTLFGL